MHVLKYASINLTVLINMGGMVNVLLLKRLLYALKY